MISERSHSLIPPDPASQVQQALITGDLQAARSMVFHWLNAWAQQLPAQPSRDAVLNPELWSAIADVVDRTGDHYLVERFWQILDRLPPPPTASPALPLLGIPVLNRVDLLMQLLDSLDHPVSTLAIVDNSPQGQGAAGTGRRSEVSHQLEALRQLGHPLVERIRIARPFTNLGVAASWNLILSCFPEASVALLVNNDVRFAPGVISAALERITPSHPQFLGLLPEPHAFSAFLLTALCWDRLGLFDPGFHPAYCEDLDYRDRLRADPEIEALDGGFAHAAMAALNQEHSATIRSDPELERQNRASFALNRLWYLSHRRIRHDVRGSWRRLWLSQWQPLSQSDHAS